MWGLWNRALETFAAGPSGGHGFLWAFPTEDRARTGSHWSTCVEREPVLIGVHPDWKRRALAAETSLRNIAADIEARDDLLPEQWEEHLDMVAVEIKSFLAAPPAGAGDTCDGTQAS